MATPEEIEKWKKRFGGYGLLKLQLDETGPSYYDVAPHPYLYNQPRYWQPAVFEGHPNGGVTDLIDTDIPTTADNPPVIGTTHEVTGRGEVKETPKGKGSLYPFLPSEK